MGLFTCLVLFVFVCFFLHVSIPFLSIYLTSPLSILSSASVPYMEDVLLISQSHENRDRILDNNYCDRIELLGIAALLLWIPYPICFMFAHYYCYVGLY